MTTPVAELESLWRRGIPMAAAMGVEIADYASDILTVRAALAPNRNVHGTAFAGSLYSICALTGWGMTWLALKARGLHAGIVLADAQIEYREAVNEDIICRCRFDAAALAQRLEQLASKGRSSLQLHCEIDALARPAVRFAGRYAVRRSAG